jgi:hypothetical protein
MNRKTTRIFFLIGVIVWLSGCGTGRQDCTKQIKEEIHPGLSSGIAETDLKKCGFKTTMDPAKKTFYGDKRVGHGLVSDRTQVLINWIRMTG